MIVIAKLKPTEAPAAATAQAGTAAAPAKTFVTEPVAATAKQGATGGINLVQRRKEKIAEAIKSGSPFTYVKYVPDVAFTCICGANGKNAHVLKDKDGKEVGVGGNCLKHVGLSAPQKERKARVPGQPVTGISRQQKFSEAMAKYTAPFKFVRKQEGPFTCICGGRGSNQIVVSDVNGAEFSVGATCASQIPGVELPKAEPKRATGAAVAGLKGTAPAAEATPSFNNVG